MTTSNWPEAYDTFHDPQANTRMNDPVFGHAQNHTLINDAVSNIEQFLGATPNFNVILNGTPAGGDLTGTYPNPTLVNPPEYGIPFTKTGVLAVTAGALRFPIYKAMNIVGVYATVNTAPQGSNPIILDILKSGSSIYTTTNNRPTISVGTYMSQVPAPQPDNYVCVLGDYIQVNILQIGDTVPGADLSVVIVTR